MTTHLGWTGGHYSIYRALLAATLGSLLWHELTGRHSSPVDATLLALGGLACLALAAGLHDRFAAAGLLLLGGFAGHVTPTMLVAAWLLVLHLFVPPAPYGSWEARARPDPGGGWRMPRRVWHAAWIGWALENGLAALNGSRALLVSPSEPMAFGGLAMIGWLLQVFVVAAAIHPPLRRPAWSAMWIWQIAWLSATGWAGSAPSFAMLHLLAVDPGWLAARSWLVPSDSTVERSCSPRVARLFYDGECGFCHRSVRFVLAEEGPSPDALRFRFAPLESPAFAEMLERHPGLAGSLPDSIVLELEDGTIRTRATAALEIASRLGGLWRLLSIAGRGLPRAALDRGYDTLARVRKRIFARPKASCPIAPPAMRERFEL